MEKNFKILAVGDIHGDTALTKKLAKKAMKENVDLVVIAGDLTFFENSLDNLIGPFHKAGKRVLLIPGNHESVEAVDFLSEMYSNVKNIHGYSIRIGNMGIFGAGGANVGPFTFIREPEMFELLENGFRYIQDSPIKIMVTHVHPRKSLVEKIAIFEGSSGIEKAIKKFQPDIALFSHIHECWGVEEKIGKTRLINVGREGKIIEIEKVI
jgi:uncharacterized protein